MADIDKQIAQLEKQLGSLYTKRVAALEGEIIRSRGLIDAFGGAPASAPAPAPKAPATKSAKKKGGKAKRAKEVPAPIQTEIFPELSAAAPAKKGATKKPKQPKKRTRTPSAVVEKRILDALKEAGLFGLSQIELSKKAQLAYQTVIRKLKDLPGVEKKGSGKEGRLFLKI